MTKVTYIGNQPTKESKHIELIKYYSSNNRVNESAEGFDRCDLVKRNVQDGLDLIICHDIKGSIGAPYLGHWNDGTTSNPDTICTVLGEDVEKPKGKGIEFIFSASSWKDDCKLRRAEHQARDFKNVLVLRYGSGGYYDEFYAWDTNANAGLYYLGHLNDGFVAE